MSDKTYTVHRSMIGPDGYEYAAGDTRVLGETDAADLVARGALSEVGAAPVTPEPTVKHTFGQGRPDVAAYTTATSDDEMAITLARTPKTPAATAKSPATPKA